MYSKKANATTKFNIQTANAVKVSPNQGSKIKGNNKVHIKLQI
jgi:hypothetical protein